MHCVVFVCHVCVCVCVCVCEGVRVSVTKGVFETKCESKCVNKFLELRQFVEMI